MDSTSTRHHVLFRSFDDLCPPLAFPCDRNGNVNLDSLTDRMRQNYYFARAVVGRVFHQPTVEVVASAM
jgi:hypothetical protein